MGPSFTTGTEAFNSKQKGKAAVRTETMEKKPRSETKGGGIAQKRLRKILLADVQWRQKKSRKGGSSDSDGKGEDLQTNYDSPKPDRKKRWRGEVQKSRESKSANRETGTKTASNQDSPRKCPLRVENSNQKTSLQNKKKGSKGMLSGVKGKAHREKPTRAFPSQSRKVYCKRERVGPSGGIYITAMQNRKKASVGL